MDLFQVVNGVAIPTTHALMIEPYKSLWVQDNSEDKNEALKDFTFIELYCSKKKTNPFKGYSEGERYKKLVEHIYKDKDYRPTNNELIEKGIELYLEFLYKASPTLSYLEAALESAERVKQMLRSVDFDERTNGGAAVYKPGDITRALKDSEEVIKNLTNLQKKVEEDLLEESKTRGAREIGQFER